MGKRRSESTPAAAAANDDVIRDPNDEGNNHAADDTIAEENDTSNYATTKVEKMWNETQSSLSNNLLPLVSSALPEEMLTLLMESTTNADNDGTTADNSSGGDGSAQKKKSQQQTRQALLQTSTKLFRYIEHLASMQEQLKDVQKQRKMRQFHNDDGDEEKKNDDGNDEDGNDVDEEEGEDEPCTLSGIPTLYTGQDTSNFTGGDYDDEANNVDHQELLLDAETIWGQVDLQNSALLPLLKKSIKKLGKRASNEGDEEEERVRILDTAAMGDDDEDDGSGEDSEDGMSEGSAASGLEEEEGGEDGASDSDEDSQARRVRERMERAMADMSDDDEDNNNKASSDNEAEAAIDILGIDKQRRFKELVASQAATLESTEGIIDPYREEMRDGFFDLHEMEAFADEEEEMLPDDAYGEEVPDVEGKSGGGGKKGKGKKKKGVLPHLRDRMGHDSEEDDEDGEGFDDEDDDEDDPLSKRFEPTTVRRKKYRADDEVEALYKLYDDEQGDNDGFGDSDDDDEGGPADASAMTAADLFGKPDEKLIKNYKAKHGKGKSAKPGKPGKGKGGTDKKDGVKKKVASFADDFNDDDADSWDNHNFEEDGVDWKDDGKDEEESEDEGGSENEEDAGEEEDNDIEEEEEEADKTKLSAHAIQSKKLEEQTLRLEQDLISEKPWKMLGEAKGTDRAQDSLLDSTPEFEVAFKPPPILTAEHTADIETMIKKRILDEDWDDVVPRELPDIGVKRGGGDAPEVSQEKSKLGLGELYEREYLKKTTGFDRDAHEKQTEEDAAKEEMKRLFANLCSQLDSLSNYHFAPRPVADEADVQNKDVPAIAMEEVLPLHVSTSRGKAPEEVYGAGKGKQSVLKGDSELDQAERKRIRNAKKAARRKARKQKHADEKLISKLQPGLGLNNPYEKRKLREELQMARASGKVVVASDDKAAWEDQAAADKEYQTSTKFFQKMQENVDSMVHGGDDGDGRAKKKRKGVQAGQSSSVYRL